jgi:hypothetical protein
VPACNSSDDDRRAADASVVDLWIKTKKDSCFTTTTTSTTTSVQRHSSQLVPLHQQKLNPFSASVVNTLENAVKWKSTQMTPFGQPAAVVVRSCEKAVAASMDRASHWKSARMAPLGQPTTGAVVIEQPKHDDIVVVVAGASGEEAQCAVPKKARSKRRNGKPTNGKPTKPKQNLTTMVRAKRRHEDALCIDPSVPSLAQSIMGADWRPTKSVRQNRDSSPHHQMISRSKLYFMRQNTESNPR